MSVRTKSWWRWQEFPVGVFASILVAIGAFGVADIPRVNTVAQDAGFAWLTYGHGKTLSGITFWMGVATLVICWVRIGRIVSRENVSYSSHPTVKQMQIAVLAWATPLTMTVPIYSRDVYAYLAQAQVFREGFNPYFDGPVHTPGPFLDSMAQVWASTTAPYGPTFMWLARGVVGLSEENPILGVQFMRACLIPGLLLSLWAIPRLAEHFMSSPEQGLWLALLNPMILIHLVAGTHVELLMMGLLVTGVTLTVRKLHVGGLTILGLAATVKITAAIVIPFILWIWLSHLRVYHRSLAHNVSLQHRLPRSVAAGVFASTIMIPLSVFGAITMVSGLGIGWLNGLRWAYRIINWLSIPTIVGHVVTWVSAPFYAFNLQSVLVYTRGVGTATLAAILIGLWIVFSRSEQSAIYGMVWAMLAVLLLEPSTLPWYYTWVLCLATALTLPLQVRALIAATSTLLLIVFQPDDSIVMYKPLSLLLAFVLAALTAVSLLKPDPLQLRQLNFAGSR